jgi:hypothetical protein
MRKLTGFAVLSVLLASAQPASAQFLALSPMTVNFPSSDPDTVPLVVAAPVRVTYFVFGAQPWTITVRANGNLVAGAASIAISNVTWVGTPNPPFRNGTLSATVAQTLAQGTGPTGLASGNVTFRLANSWNYSAGNYTQTVVFTLTSP